MTEPLVPAEVDLRDFEYMPLKVARLRRSKEWLLAKKDPALAFYSLNLWTAAWHEVPAGSLEDDDDVLADAAMCPITKWKKVREKVLRKWVKCSDGRLYHPIVAEVALDSWAIKKANRKKTDAATAARKAQRDAEREGNVTKHDKDNVTLPPRSPREVKGSEAKGRELENRDVGVTPTVVPGAHADVTGNVAVEKTEKSTAKVNGGGQQWDDKAWVTATASTVGRRQRIGESYEAWRDAVFMLVDGLRKPAQA